MVRLVELIINLCFLNYASFETISETRAEDEVIHLIGEPDFRDVKLHWQYGQEDDSQPRVVAFQIHYCELQAWGQYRCRNKVVDDAGEEIAAHSLAVQSTTTPSADRRARSYSARISGLRMATTYSFEVRPVRRGARDLADPQSISSKVVIVPTKGFSARATQCLPHASEVEVSTGPFFGGRIAVEAANGGPERCALQGNPNSAQDAYILRIHHEECGSVVNETTVATYVIVQENLPILTHSTRRFLVLCTYKPETLTVRAGINLPKASPGDVLSGDAGPVEVNNDLTLDGYGEIQPARLKADLDKEDNGVFGEVSLVMFLVIAAFGGTAMVIWKMVPQSSRDNDSISSISSINSRSIFGSRNRDRFSDGTSIYSISLSEKDEQSPRKEIECDNTSEA